MKKPNKSYDLSKIKQCKPILNQENDKFNVKNYHCAQLMTSVNVLLQGEGDNPQNNIKNALITAICMNTGTILGKKHHFLIYSFNPSPNSHRIQIFYKLN